MRKLLLLSPLGVKQGPKNFQMKRMRYKSGVGPPRWARAFASLLWGKVSPFAVLQLRSENKVRATLQRYISFAQPTDSEEEKQALIDYLF